jgi:hypothetical protein
MQRTRLVLSGLAFAGVAFGAACSEMSPTEPIERDLGEVELFGGTVPEPSAFAGGIDAEFVRIARAIPDFGGLYFDESGALTIVTTGDVQAMDSRALGAELGRIGVSLDAQPVRMQVGQYNFVQLDAMHRGVRDVLSLAGVVYTDADERANRVRIGVEDARAAASVEQALAMLNMPREAVIISETEPIEPLQTLQSRVRPIGGGLQIWRFIPPGSASTCTLGFNVRAPNRPNVQGFVTNSHCTEQRGVVTGTQWNQKELALPVDYVAIERHDPPFFQGGDCPVGRNCRYSDAAGAQYTVSPAEQAFGHIYKTTAPSQHSPGPLTIDPVNPMWTIISETPFPTVGQTMHKTGRTTGWLIGPVVATCITTNVAGAGEITLLCQDRVEATAQGGDSGSPVFLRYGDTHDVSLAGILWGGSANTFVLSSMDNIRFENPGPVGWTVYPGQTPPQ